MFLPQLHAPLLAAFPWSLLGWFAFTWFSAGLTSASITLQLALWFNPRITWRDINWRTVGRHFAYGPVALVSVVGILIRMWLKRR